MLKISQWGGGHKNEDEHKLISKILSKNDQSKTNIEDNLKSLIYGINGEDSIFEKIGSCIHSKNPNISPSCVYENTLYFIFRLLFIAYFEDRFSDILKYHQYFKDEISLQNLLENLNDKEDAFNGFFKLQKIFEIYDKGEPNYDMPIFNGGLFDKEKTKLLYTPKLFSNKDLKEILEKFFYFNDGNSLYKRDYRTLSISHLGTVYEGLLSYFFEITPEDIFYLQYSPKGSKSSKTSSIEGYFDSYDYAKIQKDFKIHKIQTYNKGQIYLKNTSNSRKSTASYYTPASIVSFLVKECLKDKITPENILTFKILDNACGSGHFLIEALNQVTSEILQNFDNFPAIKKIYDKEKQTIATHTAQYIQDYQIDEIDILKRLLLKRMIFGVDINPFSIELTKLSLWIDSFIFGTPLSFIEHHIKCGNALIGTNIASFKHFWLDYNKKAGNLFVHNFLDDFNDLSNIFKRLDSLKDSTEEDILESKRIYKEDITPKLSTLNLYLNYYNAKRFLTPEESLLFKAIEDIDMQAIFSHKEAINIIKSYASKYRFFNYEIEFPEIVEDTKFKGFQAIVGNPPWDKTKFDDSNFFPQYKSDYRTLKNSQKDEFAKNLLSIPSIKSLYEDQKATATATTKYYKANYPLNYGSGDSNLFRFFVEANLSLLDTGASLAYVLPSALMFEEGSFSLRKHILTNKTLHFFYSFENRNGIFADVDIRYKFALMQIQNTTPEPNHSTKTMFYKTNINSIYNPDEIIPLNLENIRCLSPQHLSLMELRHQKELKILKKCYEAFPKLSLQWLDFRNELHMTADKDLFLESFSEGLIPLYEGKMIHQFNAYFANPKYFLHAKSFDERLKCKEIYRLKQDLNLNQKEYEKLINQHKLKEKDFIKYDREFFRLGFRAIAGDTNERTTIFSLLPKNIGCGNSLWSSVPKSYYFSKNSIKIKTTPYIKILFALGIFNSILMDFILRQIVQINVNKTYIERIPIPQPEKTEILQNPLYSQIALNALKLQLYDIYDRYDDFTELAYEFGISKSDIPSTPKLYDMLRVKNDISIAKLYGIDFEEFCYLLGSFKLLNSKQPEYIAALKNPTHWQNT
ncbi:N-6 DNA methylase [Helicobacter sp. 13S00477-4]|uniref:Eco57I restriction-modification methylase domain-containing protein n=1 Tax=Helicobacter sp. 13S00477-4 TaxID=1905759 RepID=UPI002151F1A6|nr:N-6 DNA methylase [Helicobacter sp. 13S00477-4]